MLGRTIISFYYSSLIFRIFPAGHNHLTFLLITRHILFPREKNNLSFKLYIDLPLRTCFKKEEISWVLKLKKIDIISRAHYVGSPRILSRSSFQNKGIYWSWNLKANAGFSFALLWQLNLNTRNPGSFISSPCLPPCCLHPSSCSPLGCQVAAGHAWGFLLSYQHAETERLFPQTSHRTLEFLCQWGRRGLGLPFFPWLGKRQVLLATATAVSFLEAAVTWKVARITNCLIKKRFM